MFSYQKSDTPFNALPRSGTYFTRVIIDKAMGKFTEPVYSIHRRKFWLTGSFSI